MRTWWENNGIHIVFVGTMVSILAMCAFVIWLGFRPPGPEIYEAWLRANPGVEMTLEDWRLLERRGLLPCHSSE